jgi:sugar phosphate isomerase/epimerase
MRWSFATIVLAPRGGAAAPPDAAERRRVLRTAAEIGFEGVELSPRWFDFLGLTPAELRDFRGEVESAGLRVSGLNLNRHIPTRSPDADRHREMMARAVDAAGDLGADVVTVSLSMPASDRPPLRGCDVPDEEHDRAADWIAELGRRGVSISVELHDDGLLDTPELCLRMFDRVGLPNVGANPDVGNLCRGPGPPADWRSVLAALAPRANNWHVKNYRDLRPAPVWDGVIDYAEAVAVMRRAGYRGWVSVESYFGDVWDLQRRSLEYLRRVLAAA